MVRIERTNATQRDFIALVRLLDRDLEIRDGKEHTFYAQFNKIQGIKFALVAYEDDVPIGCGALKEFSSNVMEIKRMYVLPVHRGQGIAWQMLEELEKWALEMGFSKCILETGQKQPEAIALYKKCGYLITSNYGQYHGIENSICFEKSLI